MGKEEIIQIRDKGAAILRCPLWNKGTAFTQEERDELGLNGLLPPKISSIEQQIKRTYLNYSKRKTPLAKYQSLMALMMRNELLFYQFAACYPEEVLPIIYTPNVGDAAMEYSRIYFHQRGLYLPYPLKEKIEELIFNYPTDDIEVIVVTDGERILGLGDLGIGGMTIPVGKLSLYTLFGGVHPGKTLPIILDVGTDNEELLHDELYLGWNHKRIRGAEYDDFIEGFVKAVRKRYPKVLLQWEDFGKANARRILHRYQKQILSFNDDIQGTASVALGALLAALKVQDKRLKEENIVIFGAGSAGLGIADMITVAMREEGLSEEEACKRIFLIDVFGLIHSGTRDMTEGQRRFAHPLDSLKGGDFKRERIDLMDVIRYAKPSVLIGVSAQTGAFSQKVIEEMSKVSKRPIIFPLSNPTSKAECTPQEVFTYSMGKGIVATGSPFPYGEFEGKKIPVSQCNNVYIFPGIGLGALISQAQFISEKMFLAAAKALANFSPMLQDPLAPLLPKIKEVRNVSIEIARTVALAAIEEGIAGERDIEKGIGERVWDPCYPRFVITKPL